MPKPDLTPAVLKHAFPNVNCADLLFFIPR